MNNKVARTIDRCNMPVNGSTVIVALSGGADSVALLHCLISLKEEYNLTVHAAHLNHQIRGEEADRDENFCKILCENYNIPFHLRRRDIKAISKQQKISEELCGRHERYAFFDSLAESLGALVATAHTASDNAETLLFNLSRGTSLAGAAGIPPVRGHFIRPLIDCTRAEIEEYCRQNHLDFVTDSTNFSDEYTRNKIRHHVIPALAELNPRFEESASRFCDSVRLAEDFLRQSAHDLLRQADENGCFRAADFLSAHPAVKNQALALLCKEQAEFSVEARHIELLNGILCHGGAVDLGLYVAVCKQGLLRVIPKQPEKPLGIIFFNGKISFEYRGKEYSAVMDNSDTELNNLVFRSRQSGDSFTFPARNVTKPLRKALNEKKIPDEHRDRLVLLCAGSTVLWCEKLGFSKQGEALKHSSNLQIKVKNKGAQHA